MAIIKAICLSEKKGTAKHPVKEAKLVENYGLEGDAHAGNWHRQVSLLSFEKVQEFKVLLDESKGLLAEKPSQDSDRTNMITDGCFGENLLIDGIDLRNLPVGTLLEGDDFLLEVTQIGKECHSHCRIAEAVGKCIMPTEGIFAKVVKGGTINPGDRIEIREKSSVRL